MDRFRSARQGEGCVQSAVVCRWWAACLADVVLTGGWWKRKQSRAVVEIREAGRSRGVVARELPAARRHPQHTTQGAASQPSPSFAAYFLLPGMIRRPIAT